MKRLFIVIAVLAALPILAVIVIAPFAIGTLRGVEQVYDGTISLEAGLEAPVEVIRDRHAIPHIRASSMADAYRALGFLHAQDRLFQMEMQRRAGQGRLAEIAGRAALRFDKMSRTLRLYENAQAAVGLGTPEQQAALEAYADGVNAYLESDVAAMPMEFHLIAWRQGRIAPYRPEPWVPADSVVWGKLMGLQLSGNLFDEIRRALLATEHPPEIVDLLTRYDTSQDPVSVATPQNNAAAGPMPTHPHDITGGVEAAHWRGLLDNLPRLGPSSASNAWAVHGSRTATGAPILGSDPHLSLDAPGLWYLARIDTPKLDLTGATVPGVPFHVLGQNEHIAWGLTTAGGDVNDLFVERLDPSDKGRYLTQDGPVAFETIEDTIPLPGGETETLTIRSTRHGVVISDLDERLEPLTQNNRIVTLRTTLSEPGDTGWMAIHDLNRATDWESFQAAAAQYKIGQQNMIYADRDGTIGLYAPALIPVRREGDGSAPLTGDDRGPNWAGWVPPEQLPAVRNPAQGWVANANNRLVDERFPHLITTDWESPFRMERIVDVLSTQEAHNVADSEALMTDTLSMAALALKPLMLSADGSTDQRAEALALLSAWDGRMATDRPEPLIFMSWLTAMTDRLVAQRLGDQRDLISARNPRLVLRLMQTAPEWCDLPRTAATESCTDASTDALSRSLAELSDAYGREVSGWRWGDAHRAPLGHQILARVPLVGASFRQDLPMPGGNYTVLRAATWSDSLTRFPAMHGAGFRAVYDLGNPANSRFMIATGQSGHPFSDFWDNFSPAWIDGAFIQIPADQAGARRNAVGQLTLISP